MLNQLKPVIGACLLLSLFSWEAQAKVIDKISQSFNVDAAPKLNLQNINGNVTINAWNKNVITVNAVITADTQQDRDNVKVIIEQTGRGIDIESKYQENSKNNNNTAEVVYSISVPNLAELASIELVNGALNITDVKGEIVAKLVNGSFTATNMAGNANISSVNGSIKASYQNNIEALDDINIEAVNGTIKLYLPNTIGADINVDTMHGSVKNDFGLSVDKGAFFGSDLEGVIGDGKVDINIETVNGSVKILNN